MGTRRAARPKARGRPTVSDLVREHLADRVRCYALLPEPRAPNWRFKSFEEYLLASGTLFTSKPLTKGERIIVFAAIHRCTERWEIPFQQEHCFLNAAALAQSDESGLLRYVEGEAQMNGDVVVHGWHHAWVTVNGKVIDLTYSARGLVLPEPEMTDRVLGLFDEARFGYFGVEFDVRDVKRIMMLRERADGILWSQEGMSLLIDGTLSKVW